MTMAITWTFVLVLLSCTVSAQETKVLGDECGTDQFNEKEEQCMNSSSTIDKDFQKEGPFFYTTTLNNINGKLSHKYAIEGNCFDILYKIKGKDDHESEKKPWPWNSAKSQLLKEIDPEFGKVNKCQKIQLSGHLKYRDCKGYTSFFYLGQKNIIPIYDWLEMKKEIDHSFPVLNLEKDKIPSISWGDANKFGCNSDNIQTKITIEYKMEPTDEYKIRHKVDNGSTTNEKYTISDNDEEPFSTKEYPSLNLNKQEQCYDWIMNINTNFTLHKISSNKVRKNSSEEHYVQFIRIMEKKRNVGKLLTTTSKNKTNGTTKIEITREDDSELECLNTTVEIIMWKNGNYTDERRKIEFSSESKAYVDLGTTLDTKCQEAVVFLVDANIPEIHHIQTSFPALKDFNQTSDDTIIFSLKDEQFKNCTEITHRIECNPTNSSTTDDPRNITLSKTGIFTIPNLANLECLADAFIHDADEQAINELRPPKLHIIGGKIMIIELEPKQEKTDYTIVIILITLIVSVVAMVISYAAVMFKNSTKRKRSQNLKRKSVQSFKRGNYPHIIVSKDEGIVEGQKTDENILRTINNLVEIQDEVIEEFNKIETYSNQNIRKNESTTLASSVKNIPRNRYKDMVPYNSNIVWLKSETGDPSSKYMNASDIKFDGMNQRFIASQAPKPNMFGSFWQMVWEQNVSVIVMITNLNEYSRIKAHQYWPDKDEPEMKWPDVGIEAKYEKHSFPGTFYQRSLTLTNKDGKKKEIEQLQTVEWIDMSAPKSTKILLDLIYKSEDLTEEMPGPILVHCSAGVGRTGTYIGLYKLVNDYNDNNVRELDFFQTVIEMRKQRMKMVQKPLQYHYMIKCLADYIARETSDYA